MEFEIKEKKDFKRRFSLLLHTFIWQSCLSTHKHSSSERVNRVSESSREKEYKIAAVAGSSPLRKGKSEPLR